MALSRRLETAVRSSSGSPCTLNRWPLRGPMVMKSGGLQVMPRAGQFHAFADQFAEIHFGTIARAAALVARLAGLQHLLHRS